MLKVMTRRELQQLRPECRAASLEEALGTICQMLPSAESNHLCPGDRLPCPCLRLKLAVVQKFRAVGCQCFMAWPTASCPGFNTRSLFPLRRHHKPSGGEAEKPNPRAAGSVWRPGKKSGMQLGVHSSEQVTGLGLSSRTLK